MATIKLGNTKVANKLISYAEKKAVEREGIDCNPEYAKSQFATTRELYGKTEGIQAHHIIQSFKPGEITPDQANKVGVDLSKKLAKGHECMVYTHSDKKHIHNHIVINAVNYDNGRKFQLHGKKSIENVRELSDEICKEKGLSVVKEPSAKIRYTQSEQGILERGQTSWKDTIRESIDHEKANSKTYEDFKKNLKENYRIEINDKKKYITYKLEGHKRGVRGKTLGMDYERGTIENGFNRQVERDTSKTRRNTDLSNIKRTESSGSREFVEGNKRTQSTHEGLHKSSLGRGNSEKGNAGRTVSKVDEYINGDSKEDDFDFEKARKHSRKLRQDLNESYGKWKDSNEQQQPRSINSNESDRENSQDKHQRDGKELTKKLERHRTNNLDFTH